MVPATARIAGAEPLMAPLMRSCRIATNCTFAKSGQLVCANDELALIGMVSGG